MVICGALGLAGGGGLGYALSENPPEAPVATLRQCPQVVGGLAMRTHIAVEPCDKPAQPADHGDEKPVNGMDRRETAGFVGAVGAALGTAGGWALDKRRRDPHRVSIWQLLKH